MSEFDAEWQEHKSKLDESRDLGGDDVTVFAIDLFCGREGLALLHSKQ